MICVNVTDKKNNQGDLNCELDPADDSRITKPSVVLYECAVEMTEAALQDGERRGILEKRAPISAALLQKIRNGAMKSDDLKRRFKELVRDNY